MIETSESLTLDMASRTRATEALMDAMREERAEGFSPHDCSTYDGGDGCNVCWEIAAAVVRAAEGLRWCRACNGTGDVGASASLSCPSCGGDGLEPLPLSKTRATADSRKSWP